MDEHISDRINDVEVAALVGREHAKTALDVACWNDFGNWAGFLSCDLLDGCIDVQISIMSSAHLVGSEALPTLAYKDHSECPLVDANGDYLLTGVSFKSTLFRMTRACFYST